jgi:secondary thiamine-phosphate synthase enzyme
MIEEFGVATQNRYQLIDITQKVEKMVGDSGVEHGLVFIFVPHSTAALLLSENEPGLKEDWLNFLKRIVSGIKFQHNRIDDNADSHILSGLLKQERTLIIEKGKLVRGTWQQIFLVELDGPRRRKLIVKILSD